LFENLNENESRLLKEMTMTEEKKTVVETPVVAGPVVSQAAPALADAIQAIAPAPQAAPIVLAQVTPAAPATVGEKK
jgi:hypothetical protein